jgi:hypothetical protein
MTVTPLENSGNSSKFRVAAKTGEFDLAISFTLRTKVWKLGDATAELLAAQELAEAIVSRHDPALPYKPLYIFAEHNVQATYKQTLDLIRKNGIN